MSSFTAEPVRVRGEGVDVAALLVEPEEPANSLLVLAHGAGAGMEHPHLERLAQRLAGERVATLRYQFPYRERGGGRPDRAPVLETTVRCAVATAESLRPDLPLYVGGRSMGARMSVRAHAARPLPVEGLVLFAFPLHRPVNLDAPDPSLERAEHIGRIDDPMLFFCGTRDRLSRLRLLEPVLDGVPNAALHVVEGGDHGFVPTKKTGKSIEDVEAEMAAITARWMLDRRSVEHPAS